MGNPKDSRWFATPREDRRRKPLEITLSDEARAKLDRLAKRAKTSKSRVIEELILDA